MDSVIGIDIGTQSTKALLVDAEGRILAQHSQRYRVDTPQPLWAEQWPDVWLAAVFDCIRGCLAHAPSAADSVRGICVSSLYGGSGIPVDDRIEPLHPCLIWMDRRAQQEVDWIKSTLDLDRLHAITGNGVDSYYGYTKMLWLKAHRPEVWAKTRYLLPPNSYVNYHLCGEIAIDHSSAGNIGGIYDLVARQWSPIMADTLGLDLDKLPQRLVDSTDSVGDLLPEVAASLGLPSGIPVVAGGVDAAMATLAAGATRPGKHVAMIGTSMCWGYIGQQVDARHGLISMPHVLASQRDLYTFGGALTAGASVSWFVDTFCQAEQALAETAGQEAHERLETQARTLEPGAQRLLFLPYLMGERSPIWDSKASGAFVGLSLYHQRHHLYRAVLEGVSYALRHNMQAGAKADNGSDPSLDPQLIVVGGAAQSDLWMQIVADVTGYCVVTFEEDVEAALGAALLAGLCSGVMTTEKLDESHGRQITRATPDPGARQRYDQLYRLYCELYPALKPVLHELATTHDAGKENTDKGEASHGP